MLSPSNLPVRDAFSPGSPLNYESLYLKEKDKNAILLSRIHEKENLISQLHQANDEAYDEIRQLEEKLQTLQNENDEKVRILIQRESEISALRKQASRISESGYIRENGTGLSLECGSLKDPSLGAKNSFEMEHKKLKYMTLGNDRKDLDMLYGNFKENDVEKMKHDLRVYEKFYETLARAVVDCSPPDMYKLKPPNLKQIWKWIRNLIEEYMTIKTKNKD